MAAIFSGGREGAWRRYATSAGEPVPVIVDGTLEVIGDGSWVRCMVCVNGRYYEVEGPQANNTEGSEIDDEVDGIQP